MAQLPTYMYSVSDKKSKAAVFVNGNTRKLIDLNQKDLAVLFNNGDTRVTRDEKSDAENKKKAVEEIAAS